MIVNGPAENADENDLSTTGVDVGEMAGVAGVLAVAVATGTGVVDGIATGVGEADA